MALNLERLFLLSPTRCELRIESIAMGFCRCSREMLRQSELTVSRVEDMFAAFGLDAICSSFQLTVTAASFAGVAVFVAGTLTHGAFLV
jgi:hypothetical protein